MIKLKKAYENDIALIRDVQRKAFMPLYKKYKDNANPANVTYEDIETRYSESGSTYYLIDIENEESENLIGIARIKEEGKACDLKQICILPEYQGNGYAQRAMIELEELYPNANLWKLDTIKQEEKLCHLYSKMGYKLTGKEENIQEGMDIVYFEKKIK